MQGLEQQRPDPADKHGRVSVHAADRPVFGKPALARAQVDLPPPVAALRPGDPLEDGCADPGPEAVHVLIIGPAVGWAENRFAAGAQAPRLARTDQGRRDAPG